jgi:4-hydroxy-tetrahydrodipicolinate reductase
MRELVRVVVLGTGQMGSGIARLVLERHGLELAGAFARRPGRAGTDVGRAIGLERDLGMAVAGDLAELLDATRPRVAIQATCSRLDDALPEIEAALERGVRVVSIAEEMAFPAAANGERAARLDALARSRGVALLGTGVNPGFVLDLLVVVLSGVCAKIASVTAQRVNDLSPYGPSVLRSQGVGLSPDAFREGVADGTVVGHVGFAQSIGMIAAALGLEIERIEETREPIVSRVRRSTPFVTVEPGQVAGCLHRAVAFADGRPVVTLVHPQQIHPELEGVQTGDSIQIEGTPPVRLSGSPEIPGGEATCALAVNAIPRVLAAAPGLHAMIDVPPPAAPAGLAAARPAGRVARGTWVELRRVVLAPGERAPQVPDDTQRVPLEMRVKGFLARAAALGEEAEIETRAGRRLSGTLVAALPGYAHGFGPPLAELLAVGEELRSLLREEPS